MTPTGKRKLRVLTMVDGIGAYGGGESLAGEITRRLDPERFDRSFCVTRWEERPEYERTLEAFQAAGVEFIGLNRSARVDLAQWRRVVAFMRARRIDVLHTHKLGSNFWGALLSPLASVPIFVAHEHTWSFQGEPLRRFLDRELIARRADAFIAVSREDERKMAEIERIPRSKLRLVANGIPDPLPGSGADVRAELGIDADAPVIGVVATLRPQKALDVLIGAADHLRRDFPDLRVLIAGGVDSQIPEEKVRIRELIAARGLERTVLMLGLRLDIPDVLAALDVAVLSSDYEGSPLALMECMEAGLPIVATAVGGVPDVVEDGVTGLLTPPRDPGALATAVSRLLADRELAERMGEAGRTRRRTVFTIDATTRAVESLYEELYAAKAAHSQERDRCARS